MDLGGRGGPAPRGRAGRGMPIPAWMAAQQQGQQPTLGERHKHTLSLSLPLSPFSDRCESLIL